MLDAVEVIERAKSEDRQLRLAFLTAGVDPELLFPELRTVSDDSAEMPDSYDEEGNPIEVKYDFSHAELPTDTREVEEEIAAMLAAASSGTSTLEETSTNEWM